jgi:hypothetical protein
MKRNNRNKVQGENQQNKGCFWKIQGEVEKFSSGSGRAMGECWGHVGK